VGPWGEGSGAGEDEGEGVTEERAAAAQGGALYGGGGEEPGGWGRAGQEEVAKSPTKAGSVGVWAGTPCWIFLENGGARTQTANAPTHPSTGQGTRRRRRRAAAMSGPGQEVLVEGGAEDGLERGPL